MTFELINISAPIEAMPKLRESRGKKRKKSNRYGRGTFLEAKMFLSPAFLSLGKRGTSEIVSTASAQMLILLLGKRQFGKVKDRHGARASMRQDDNKFTLTYKELLSRGISQTRGTRGFDELLAKGFIKIADAGGAFEKHKALYSLIDDYLNWRPGDPPVRVRGRDCHRGFQGKGLGAVKIISTHVNVGHPHTRQRCTPPKKTHTSTRDTQNNEKML